MICSIAGCDRAQYCRGWCKKHYTRMLTHGDPLFTHFIRGDDTSRFWSKVDKSGDDCWLWTGGFDKDGYGRLQRKGKLQLAHRVSLTLHGVDLIDGLVVDHLCRERSCVRPSHLDQVTVAENVARGLTGNPGGASKTLCANGHPLTITNTYRDSHGWRSCRQCRNDRDVARGRPKRSYV